MNDTLFGGYYGFDNENNKIEKQQFIPDVNYKKNNINFEFAALSFDNENENVYSYYLEGFENRWSDWTSESKKSYTNLNEGTYTFHIKSKNVYGKEGDEDTYTFTILAPWYRTGWAYLAYGIGAIALVYLIIQLSVRRLKRAKIKLEAIVVNRTAEVVAEKEEVEKQKKIVDVKQKQIVDSINYAKRIQKSILIPEQSIQQHLPNSFVLFIPRDIVSGDFYWFHQHENQSIVVCADCTGHGVPGAFLSMVGSTLLNEIVIQKQITDPANIMKLLAAGVSDTLKHKEKDEIDTDGMDISICTFKNKEVYFAAANNPVYVVNQNGLMEIEPQVNSINGIFEMNTDEKIESIPLSPEAGSMVYLSTDGFADQPGQKTNKKLYSAGFEKLLTQIHQLPLIEQKEKLAAFFIEWKGNLKQHDDILVMGVRV
jgi:serine phosphatase RsbU (regulator of sigma subunit)